MELPPAEKNNLKSSDVITKVKSVGRTGTTADIQWAAGSWKRENSLECASDEQFFIELNRRHLCPF